MTALKVRLGQRLKYLRTWKGLTQEELSELIGINQRQLTRIETGRNFPSSQTLEKICESLEIKLIDLFNFDNEIPSEFPQSVILTELSKIKNTPQKLKFITLAIQSANNNKKALLKLQSMIEGMLVLQDS